MVGTLFDIPCVGKIVDRLSDAMVEALFRGLKYMFCYKALVEILDSEIEKANTEEVRMSNKVAAAKADGKIIYADVLKWQTDMEEFRKSAEEFSETIKSRSSWRCIRCLPVPNPVSRFRLGREAVRKAKTVTELSGTGMKLLDKEIAHLPPIENLPNTNTKFENFQSRKDAYGKLWEQLVKEGSPLIIGIYGMPGVGKTRIMEQLWRDAMKKGIFKKVTRANVSSEKLDVVKLQNQIAGYLNCNFESQDNVVRRASQLKTSLINGGKTLIILDDVWREIPLEDVIGTSFGDNSSFEGSKILLTSRKRDICLSNKCKHPIEITTLKYNEALDLFKNTVGADQIESLQDETLVHEVCRKCAGLPLLICAVGKALRFSTYHIWKDALYKIKNYKIESVPGIGQDEYNCLKLSFDNLKEEAKLCLLLCSLFPEDADISINTLIILATGSQLVHGGSLLAMVDILKSSSLLLECKNDRHYKFRDNGDFKMHDVIRDVARSIGVKEYQFLFARCGGRRLPDNYADYGTKRLLHLDLASNDFQFPDDLVCPDMHTLSLRSESKDMFQAWDLGSMFMNLRLLMLVNFSWEQQFSLQPLAKLRTLVLDHCNITMTDVSFLPRNLETLCIWNCGIPCPLDLPNLKYLRKLEIFAGTVEKVKFVPDTISRLSSVEELHIPYGFEILNPTMNRVDNVGMPLIQLTSSILEETSKLTRLTSLQNFFRNSEAFQHTNVFSNLLKYDIRVGIRPQHGFPSGTSTRLISLSGHPEKKHIRFYPNFLLQLEGFESLMERAEQLMLWLTHDKVSSISNSNREAFADLRYMYIKECITMGCIANISHDEVGPSLQPRTSFSKLTILDIIGCHAMKYLFCNCVAKCLIQLQQLRIENCPVMEAIVMNECTSDGDIINFSKLKSLTLLLIPRLKSFCRKKNDMDSSLTSITKNGAMIPSIDQFQRLFDDAMIPSIQFQPLFDEKVAFSSLEKLHIQSLSDTSDIWEKQFCSDNVSSSFSKLKSLDVSRCNKLESVIPLAMLHRLQNLKKLRVSGCNTLMSEVDTYGSNTAAAYPLVAFSAIELIELPSLTKTGLNLRAHSGAMTLYPNLTKLDIRKCNSLENVFLPSVARDLTHLKKMSISRCEVMREIIGGGEHNITDGIVFPQLMYVQLHDLPSLTSLWCYPSGKANTYFNKVEFPNLVQFELSSGKTDLEMMELGKDDFTCQLNSLNISCNYLIKLPDKWLLRLYNLEKLTLRHCWWHELKTPCFQRLKVLKVYHSGCTTLFAFSVLRSLQQLQDLEISSCALLEQIVKDVKNDKPSGVDKETITLFQLKSLTLENLPNLKSFIPSANYECHMPALKRMKVNNCGFSTLLTCCTFGSLGQLKELEISNCALLKKILEDARGDGPADMYKKPITLCQLKSVSLKDMPNLKSVFTCSDFKNLQQLEILKVQDCRLLESIVENVRDDENFDADKKIITVPQLSQLHLKHLPNLKSFSSTAIDAFSMPKLIDLVLYRCPQVENFTSLRTSTGIVSVFSEWHQGKIFVPDLNDYIRQHWKRGSSSSESAGEMS